MIAPTCPECGARLAEGAERCDLCGSPVEAGVTPDSASEVPADIPEPKMEGAVASESVFCNQCGWQNPPQSRFCSRCGSKLQMPAAPAPPVKPGEAQKAATAPPVIDKKRNSSQGSIGMHVGILVGLSVLVVVALFMVSVISKKQIPQETNASAAPADVLAASVIEAHENLPVDEKFAPTADSLEQVIAQSEGEKAIDARRELAAFLLGIGRLDRAAIEQQRVAENTGDPADRQKSADLFFDWMESIENEEKSDVALLAIDELKKVLELAPDNLDARAKLGWAYQFDPASPMEAIKQTNQVLERDPNHIMANYNRAVFLTRINRLEEAKIQFEKVRDLAEEGSLFHRRAEAWIDSIRRVKSETAG